MKEYRDILAAYQKSHSHRMPSVLATLVEVEGSAYRSPGARMLITPEGEMVGTLGGGCFEEDLLERAKEVFRHGRAQLIEYDTTSEEEILWGFGSGCKGVVKILVEKLSPGEEKVSPLELFKIALEEEKSLHLATFYEEREDSVAFHRVARLANGEWRGQIPPEKIQKRLQEDWQTLSAREKCKSVAFDGQQALLEIIQPICLVILGGGPDAVPLCRQGAQLGWKVKVYDHRPARARREIFPQADSLTLTPWKEIESHLKLHSLSGVIITTHNYLADRDLLKMVLASPAFYTALVGSQKRKEALLSDLADDESFDFLPAYRERLFSPAGLDIGSESPQEIALAIAGEMMAVFTGRQGGFLKERKGRIHSS